MAGYTASDQRRSSDPIASCSPLAAASACLPPSRPAATMHGSGSLHRTLVRASQPCSLLRASRPLECRLSQHGLPISIRRHRIAALAELGVAAAVAHDPAHLLALDI